MVIGADAKIGPNNQLLTSTFGAGVTCHFSLHAELPFRGKMEWIFIPFYPARVKWNGHAIPNYPFPVQNYTHAHFPPFLPTCFSL